MKKTSNHPLRRIWLLSLLLLGAFTWQQGQSDGASTQEERAVATAKALHQAGKYPSHLPVGRRAPRPTRGCSSDSQFSSSQIPGIAYAPWVLLGLALLLLLITLWPRWMRKERTSPPNKEAKASHPHVLGRPIHEETLESYLHAEDWEGAICWLLYQAMRQVGWQPDGAGKGLTAREVIFQVPAQAPATIPLRHLLQIAESTRFGGVKADPALLAKAQEAYQTAQTLLPPITHTTDQTVPITADLITKAPPPTNPKPHDPTGAR